MMWRTEHRAEDDRGRYVLDANGYLTIYPKQAQTYGPGIQVGQSAGYAGTVETAERIIDAYFGRVGGAM